MSRGRAKESVAIASEQTFRSRKVLEVKGSCVIPAQVVEKTTVTKMPR